MTVSAATSPLIVSNRGLEGSRSEYSDSPSDGLDFVAEASFAIREVNELQVAQPRDSDSPGQDERPSKLVGTITSARGDISEQGVVKGELLGSFLDTDAGSSVALWVSVYQKYFEIVRRKGSSQIDRGSGFANASLLVSDGDYSCHVSVISIVSGVPKFHVKPYVRSSIQSALHVKHSRPDLLLERRRGRSYPVGHELRFRSLEVFSFALVHRGRFEVLCRPVKCI